MPKRKSVSGKCACGSSYALDADEDRADEYVRSFWRSHSGAGHGQDATPIAKVVPIRSAKARKADQGAMF